MGDIWGGIRGILGGYFSLCHCNWCRAQFILGFFLSCIRKLITSCLFTFNASFYACIFNVKIVLLKDFKSGGLECLLLDFPFSNSRNQFPVSAFLSSASMWRTDCRRGAAPWTPRPALAPVWSRPTFLTASGGSPSCTAPTRTLTFHPKVHPGTPPLPVICKFRCTSARHQITIRRF